MSITRDNFFGISALKQYVKKTLLSNQNIVNLILNKSDNMLEFEDMETGSQSLARQFVKQYKYVPETVENESVYITMQTGIDYTNQFSVKNVDLIVYIFAHVNLMDMVQGARTDILAGYIDNAINGSDSVGIGRLELIDGEEYNPIQDYYGWALRYSIFDVNRVGKKI